MALSAASIQPKPLTLHATHSFTVELTRSHVSGTQRMSCPWVNTLTWILFQCYVTLTKHIKMQMWQTHKKLQRFMRKLTGGMTVQLYKLFYQSPRCSPWLNKWRQPGLSPALCQIVPDLLNMKIALLFKSAQSFFPFINCNTDFCVV